MSELLRPDVMLAIAVMAIVTVVLRTGGYFAMGFVPVTPRVRRMLDALPGSIIAAAIVPVMVQGGAVAILAICASMLVMKVSRSDFIAVIASITLAALARHYVFL